MFMCVWERKKEKWHAIFKTYGARLLSRIDLR